MHQITRARLLSGEAQRCFHRALSGRPQTSSTRLHMPSAQRHLHQSPCLRVPPAAPKSKDRGPASKESTQTDFNAMNILSNTPPPTTAIDVCMEDGFALNSGLRVTEAGVLLYGGEAFKWRPWLRDGRKEGTASEEGMRHHSNSGANARSSLRNSKGQLDVDRQAWGILDLAWPKPDILIIGTGKGIVPLSPATRRDINELGIRIEVQDTRNAAAQFNLLATERGTQQVAAALVPIGWR